MKTMPATTYPEAAPVTAVELAARATHEVNRIYCAATGDVSQVPWEQAPDWQKESARNGVRGILAGTVTTPEKSHESWMAEKVAAGWVHGAAKDADAKTHPCLVPYADLPAQQRAKDALFFTVATAVVGAYCEGTNCDSDYDTEPHNLFPKTQEKTP